MTSDSSPTPPPLESAARAGRKRRSLRPNIAARLLLTASFFFALCTCIVVYLSMSTQREAFYSYANEICLTSNTLAAYAIDGDQLEKFAATLTPDDDYRKFAQRLDDLFARIQAKYLYVLTDNGTPGMYTYIYDATHSQEFPGERYALGRQETVDEYKGAELALKEGRSFTSAVYYNDAYGELYYAYAPIFNSKGQVVAFVGTDIDIAPLNSLMRGFMIQVGVGFALSCLAFVLCYYLMIGRIYTRPTQILIDSARGLARGDLELHIPGSMLNRDDEIGQLAKAFSSANTGVVRLSRAVEDTLYAVHDGSMSRRADASGHEGAFQRVIMGLNSTMESICRHFDDMPCAVAFFNPQGELLYANLAADIFAAHLGMDNSADFVHTLLHEGRRHGNSMLDDLLAVEEPSLSQTAFLAGPDGRHAYSLTLLRGAGSPDNQGARRLCLMLVAADITELAHARQTAEEATQAKSDFLARMSHEIRTPMNAILGLAYLALKAEPGVEQRAFFLRIQAAAESLLGIINDILDFSKIEARKLEMSTAPFRLRNRVCIAVDMVNMRAAEKGIDLSAAIAPDVPEFLLGDENRLGQVLLNLMGNAVKFTSEGGVRLEVELESRDDDLVHLRFSVHDTGIGIDALALAHLFRPFAQADGSITRRFGGTGLGLVISRELAQLMGGSLDVSSAPGEGSTFTAILPFTLNSDEADQQDEEPAYLEKLRGVRVLLVEDNEINQLIGRSILEQAGMVVDVANNGQEAVHACQEQKYDLVLMDIQMPVMDGLEAARRIRALPPPAGNVPIVAMTAHAMEQDRRMSLEAGMNGHTTKPIEPDKLFATLAGLLESD